MLVHFCGAPTWQPEKSVNIWNLVRLLSRLIIGTEPTNIYTSTFPNTLTPKKANYHKIIVYFSANVIGAVYHTLP